MYKEIHIHDITWPCHKITYDTIAMIKKQCKGHLQFYRMFVTVSMMIVRDVSRDIWYLMIFKIVFNHHLSWCQRFMIQASGCLWWYFFSFFTVLLLESLKDQWKSGEKCSNYRSYDLTHQRDWKSLNFLKIEMVCCLKSLNQEKTTPLLSVVFCGWTLMCPDFHGHEMVTRHQHRVTSKLGWHTWVGTYAAERLWCLQCRPLSVALQGRLIVSTSNKTMEDRIT